jgi:hypothetical protein
MGISMYDVYRNRTAPIKHLIVAKDKTIPRELERDDWEHAGWVDSVSKETANNVATIGFHAYNYVSSD